MPISNSFHGELTTWLGRLPTPEGKPFVLAYEHGTLRVEMFAPRGVDTQTPHRQDEVYVVVRGEGYFVNGPDRHRCGPGDLLFVPAGVVTLRGVHRRPGRLGPLLRAGRRRAGGDEPMNVTVRIARPDDRGEWLRMRKAL
jgi:hypothetical protein